MPDRPLREISRAVPTSRSPSLPGRMKAMSHWAATARTLWELQANANAESASRKINPPWAMRWPLTMCGMTVIASVASPALTLTISMPRPWLASSSFHIASAQARARSSGESVALTFTYRLPVVSNVIVVYHALFGNRPRLAGQDEARLEFPRLKRIVHFHLRIALDQLGAAGRAHAALAGERQVDACAQGSIEDGLALGNRHLAALAVDDQRGMCLRRWCSGYDSFGARLAAKP